MTNVALIILVMNTLGIIGYVCMLKGWERFFGIIVLMWFAWLLTKAYKKGKEVV